MSTRKPLGTLNASSKIATLKKSKDAEPSKFKTATVRTTSSRTVTQSTSADKHAPIKRTKSTRAGQPPSKTLKTSTTSTTASAPRGSFRNKSVRERPSSKTAAPKSKSELVTTLETLVETIKGQLEEHKAESKATITKLEESVAAKTEEVAALEEKKQALEENVAHLEKELSMATQALSDLSAKHAMTSSQLDVATNTISTHVATIEDLTTTLAARDEAIASLNRQAAADEIVRRELHNTIQELKGNIRVFCRVRPLLGDERTSEEDYAPKHMAMPDSDKEAKKLVVTNKESNYKGEMTEKNLDFSFDKVFDASTSQSQCFEEISHLVRSALDGYNICIFAYGQTGSGKTFTMEGAEGEQRGMIPRAVEQIFASAATAGQQHWSYSFSASFVEIYNETVRDLLSDNREAADKLELKRPRGARSTVVEGLTLESVSSPQEVYRLLSKAAEARAVARTDANERSSRSHSIFQLHIQGENSITHDTCVSTLNLVDLAGSERLAKSKAEGERLEETKAINKSLSALGNVIMSLGNGETHVPYRNSKLTYLLQDSLGGNAKTLMFVNLNPREDSIGECINSLRFASKVNQCQIGTAKKSTKRTK